MEPLTVQGKWWAPDALEIYATGPAHYVPSTGSSLEVLGHRLGLPDGADPDDPRQAPMYIPVLHGETVDGMTLLDCNFSTARASGEGSLYHQVFHCKTLVRGIHVSGDTHYKSASVRLLYLDEWTDFGEIKFGYEADDDRKMPGRGFFVKRQPGLTVSLDDGSVITLGTAISEEHGGTYASLKTRAQFSISPISSVKLDDLVKRYVNPLIDLLTITVDAPSAVLEIKVAEDNAWPHLPRHDVRLRLGHAPTEKPARTFKVDQLATFEEIKITERLPKWFRLADELESVHGLILAFATPRVCLLRTGT